MNFLLGLLAGAILGVVAERIFGYPLDRYILEPLARKRELRRMDLLNVQNAVDGELVVVGRSAIFVHQFFPVGIGADAISAQMERGSSSIEDRFSSSLAPGMEVDLGEVRDAREDWGRRLEEEPHAWNGTSLALTRCEIGRVPTTEEPVVSMWFRETDYATARAIEQSWMSVPVARRRSIDGQDLRVVDQFLCNGFGLNCTVESADGKVLVTKRGPNARGWSGSWHTSFNEGLSVADRGPGGVIDMVAVFGRGLHEELGIDAAAVPNFDERLVIHSLILDVDTYQWGLMAHLDLQGTRYTSDAIRGLRNLGAAADDWEASSVRFIEFALGTHAVLGEIADADAWVPHGLLNLALSSIVRHPSQARHIRDALLRQKAIQDNTRVVD